MRYERRGYNLDQVPVTSAKVAAILDRKAGVGARCWRTMSIVVTGYNASHVQVVVYRNPRTRAQGRHIVADGRYARWRETGSSRAGPRAPEWVFERSKPIIKDG